MKFNSVLGCISSQIVYTSSCVPSPEFSSSISCCDGWKARFDFSSNSGDLARLSFGRQNGLFSSQTSIQSSQHHRQIRRTLPLPRRSNNHLKREPTVNLPTARQDGWKQWILEQEPQPRITHVLSQWTNRWWSPLLKPRICRSRCE